MWLNSSDIYTSVLSGTNNEASSAYLIYLLSSPISFRSLMKMRNSMGSMPDPRTIERLITRVNDLRSPSFVNLSLPVKNKTIQSIMLSAILYLFNFLTNTIWSAESNALEKSTSKHRTYLLLSTITVTACVVLIIAAVVLPVGLKPYWSRRSSMGIAGSMSRDL